MTSKSQKLKIKCFSRVNIVNPDGTLAGDSGWTGPNMITNLGIQRYLTAGICSTLAANTCANVQYMALGSTDATANASNCVPASNATGFVCEITNHNTLRHSITSASDSSSIENNLLTGFEGWASDLGYDPDSRKAEKIFKVCEKQAERLKKFLGDELYKILLWETEGL